MTTDTRPPMHAAFDLAEFICSQQGEDGQGVVLSEKDIVTYMTTKGWSLGDIMVAIAFFDEIGIGQEAGAA